MHVGFRLECEVYFVISFKILNRFIKVIMMLLLLWFFLQDLKFLLLLNCLIITSGISENFFIFNPYLVLQQIPLSHISEDVYKTSVDWIGKQPSEALGSFVLWSLDNILADLSNHQAAAKGSKKVVQQTSSKSQVAF
jgi:hypothetical protein